MIRYLVDTDIASFFLKRLFPPLQIRMRSAMEAGEVALSVVTRAELRYGQCLMEAKDRRSRLIDAFLEEMPTLEWAPAVADCYARLAAAQKRSGQPIGVLDTRIAAHALVENLILVTNNECHYGRVPELLVENWTNRNG